MRGLLRKDLELARLNIKMWGVLFFTGVIYLFNGKSMDGGSFFTAYMMFVSIGLSAGTISYDTSDHGMQFLLTLPVTRREYVKEKYLFCIGLTAVLGVISLLISMLVYRKVNMELLVSAGAVFYCAILCLALVLPLRLKYGDRGRILMGGFAVAVFAVIALCNEILQKLHINGNVENFSFARNRTWIAVGMVLVCVGCLGMSIKSSEHIMEKMEEF